MGNWNITIRGVGSHHNGDDNDADMMAADFVRQLRAKGHSVASAHVHASAENDIGSDPERYRTDQVAMAKDRCR